MACMYKPTLPIRVGFGGFGFVCFRNPFAFNLLIQILEQISELTREAFAPLCSVPEIKESVRRLEAGLRTRSACTGYPGAGSGGLLCFEYLVPGFTCIGPRILKSRVL